MTRADQADVVRSHIDDALANGGRAVVGGVGSVGARFIQPTVLVDVPEDSTAITEETFGPTVTVTKVGLHGRGRGAWRTAAGTASARRSSPAKRGQELARSLRSGMTSVNSVIAFAGIPALPFGGVGDSGFGRIHGPDGLKEFTFAKAVARTADEARDEPDHVRPHRQDRHLVRDPDHGALHGRARSCRSGVACAAAGSRPDESAVARRLPCRRPARDRLWGSGAARAHTGGRRFGARRGTGPGRAVSVVAVGDIACEPDDRVTPKTCQHEATATPDHLTRPGRGGRSRRPAVREGIDLRLHGIVRRLVGVAAVDHPACAGQPRVQLQRRARLLLLRRPGPALVCLGRGQVADLHAQLQLRRSRLRRGGGVVADRPGETTHASVPR